MRNEINIEQIIVRTKTAIESLKSVDNFLEELDSLVGKEVEAWDYLNHRMFPEERNSIFDLIEVLENELLPEAESRAQNVL